MTKKIYSAGKNAKVALVRERDMSWKLQVDGDDIVRAGDYQLSTLTGMAAALRAGVAIVLEEDPE